MTGGVFISSKKMEGNKQYKYLIKRELKKWTDITNCNMFGQKGNAI